jgi:ABC-type transporter Mla subunit MlaD
MSDHQSYIETGHLRPEIVEQLRPFIDQANTLIGEIAARRDALRDIVEQIEALEDNVDEALDEVRGGLDTLSRHL